MKDFLKMLLAVICGLLLFGFICFFILGGALTAMGTAAGSGKTVIPRSGILAVDMSAFVLGEQSNPGTGFNPGFSFAGGATLPTVGALQATRAIQVAAEDAGVKAIFLKTDGNVSDVSAVEEFRKALSAFRSSGKPIVAYVEAPTTGGYWLASVADKIYMTEYQGATITMTGVSTQSVFLKDLLDKLGVNVQLIRHGKYKSAGETFTRNSSSPENTFQYQTLVNSLWSTMRGDICKSRGMAEETLDAAIDNLELCLPEDFLKAGMVDGLVTRQGLKDKLATLAVKDKFSEVSFIDFADYAAAKVLPNTKSKNKIAIIYTEGEIVDGKETREVAGDRFAAIIDKVKADSSIKAVVLRVNSPGGSVLASEKIKHELDLLGEEKPLIASYGAYAASGGYWISNNCSKIFTDATTLTGSIGVFGMIPDFSKTAKDLLKVNVQSVSSNKHGDMYSLMRPFDANEYNYMLRSIETVYDKFTAIVSEGRGIPKETVDEIGQGRVWTGADALGINLVDEIGTLEEAVGYAAVSNGLSLTDVQIAEYPKPLSAMQQAMQLLQGGSDKDEYVKAKIKGMARPQVIARMPYQITVY